MKTLLLLLTLAASTAGCAATMRGPDTCAEIHLDTTYVLARWAGWSPQEALAISTANFWTDKHAATTSVATEWRVLGGLVNPATLPWVLCFGMGDIIVAGEPPSRAFGRRAAETTAWAVPGLGRQLHFPSVGMHDPVTPAFIVQPGSGEIEYGNAEARRVLERSFLDFETHDEDPEATLALLGIGLHTLQDSFKHCGFTAAQGHVGARPDPDEACTNLETTLACAAVTLNSLRYARRLATGRSSAPPAGWKDTLRRCFTDSHGHPEGEGRCWSELVRSQFQDDYPARDRLVERWKRSSGEDAFERALERVRETLK